jgi:hypothetical protein
MNPKRFYIARSNDSIKEFAGVVKALPILWCRDGEYKVIPKEVVQNTINVMNMYTEFDGKRTNPVPVIMWSQGIPISNLAGRALVGE